MSKHREPSIFSTRLKLFIGLPLVLLIAGGIAYDPRLYVGIVGLLTLPVALAFPLLYMTLPWRATVLGRALMSMAQAVALLYLIGLSGRLLDYAAQPYLMGVVSTYLAFALTYQLVVLVRIKLRAQRRRVQNEVYST